MKPGDKQKFAEVVTGMTTIYSAKLTPEGLELYWNAMRDWDIGDFVRTANHLVKASQFMPRPYDFEQLRRNASQTAVFDAWAAVLENVRHSDYRKGIGLGGRIEAAVRAIGGYAAIGQCSDADLHWVQKRFTDAYETISETHEARELFHAGDIPVVEHSTINAVGVRIGMLNNSKKV